MKKLTITMKKYEGLVPVIWGEDFKSLDVYINIQGKRMVFHPIKSYHNRMVGELYED